MNKFPFASSLAAALLVSGTLRAQDDSPPDLGRDIEVLQSVRAEGVGNEDATKAFQRLSKREADAILPLLRAIGSSSPLARNWLRGAVEVIVSRELEAGNALPVGDLKGFLHDQKQAPQARRLAFELIAKIDEDAAEQLVPGFLNDPSTELRRDSVALLIAEGERLLESDDRAAAKATFRKALDAARDVDQVQEIAKKLSEELGDAVDLPRHFGFLTDWHVIGPFDNTERNGFDEVFPPEKEIDLAASYPGKDGKEVSWEPLATEDDYGVVDLNEPFGKLKEATAYAYHEFTAAEARSGELRLGCKNAWKIWLNGEIVFGRDEYHRGQRIDQYKLPVDLKKGANTILVKLCQNEQKESWTVEWEFQLRVCDATGTAILSAKESQ